MRKTVFFFWLVFLLGTQEDLVISFLFACTGYHTTDQLLSGRCDMDSVSPAAATAVQQRLVSPRKLRTAAPQSMSHSLLRHIKGTVKSFHQWLASREPGEYRPMEELPPEELDAHLAEYFSTVKQSSGHDFCHSTFGKIRYNLDHYLRMHNYPHSLSKSDVFVRSRIAFNRKRNQLLHVWTDDEWRYSGSVLDVLKS